MKRITFWISIIINVVFLILLLFLSYYYREELCQKRIKHKLFAEIVMFGDSYTQYGKWNFLLDKRPVLRFSVPWLSSDQLTELIPSCIKYKPRIVFILCGGIDIKSKCFSIDNTINNFKFMADTLKANNITPVFQQLLYHPDSEEYNKIIDSINIRLNDYCFEEKIDLLELNKSLCDSSGLKKNLILDDWHFNQIGYKKWSEIINEYLKNKYK